MFSIIIPLYNKSIFIEKCLNSVLAQSFTGYEIIVVNDGSTDGGEEVVRKVMEGKGFIVQGSEVQGSRFKVQSSGFSEDPETRNPKPETRNPFNFTNFINSSEPETQLTLISQPNSGVSTARNNGVKAANFDYIAFLDADDWWEPDFLQEMVILIHNYPEAGIYGSSYNIIKNGKKQAAPVGVSADIKAGIINYCKVYASTLCMPLWTGAVVMKKEIFNELQGFKPNLKLGEDFDLWIRAALKYPLAFLNKPLANYNQDVELHSRAVGKLHDPEHHMLWNLEYLAGEEMQNGDLKILLDKLRVYGLWPYYLSGKYHEVAKKELAKVAPENYSRQFRTLYALPLWAARLYWKFRLAGSVLKRRFGSWI